MTREVNMAVSDYSTTPADNNSISGIPVSDATQVNQVDDVIRQLMADIAATGVGGSFMSTFLDDTDATTARETLSAMPAFTTSAGPGQYLGISNGSGGGLVVPGADGETWFYFALKTNVATGEVASILSGIGNGTDALDGGTGGQQWTGYGIRLA